MLHQVQSREMGNDGTYRVHANSLQEEINIHNSVQMDPQLGQFVCIDRIAMAEKNCQRHGLR